MISSSQMLSKNHKVVLRDQLESQMQWGILPTLFEYLNFNAYVLDEQRNIVYQNYQNVNIANRKNEYCISENNTIVFKDTKLSKLFKDQFKLRHHIDYSHCDSQKYFKALRCPLIKGRSVYELASFHHPLEIAQDTNPLCLMVVSDIGNWNEAIEGWLAAEYDLSKAEISICRELYEVKSTKEIACSRNTSYETVKTQLRSVLQKTELTNRVELMILLKKISVSIIGRNH